MTAGQRFLAWLRDRAGARWPVIVKTVDGAVTAFLLAFVLSLAGHGFFEGQFGTGSTWKAAALAGWIAAGSILKSGVMILLTGQPALGGLVSSQLRAQRELRTVRHQVPLRKPGRQRRPGPPRRPVIGSSHHGTRREGGPS